MLAANQGNARAPGLRDQLIAKMTSQQIEEAIQQVTQFKPSGKAPAPVSPPPQAAVPAPAAEAESLPPLDGVPREASPAPAEAAPATPPAQ